MSCRPTDENVEGPYYRPHAPARKVLCSPDSTGLALWFTGKVSDTSCCPIPGVEIDVWHADSTGRYDNDDPSAPPPPGCFRCRGRLKTDSDGRFAFRTMMPGNYQVAGGGWVRVKHLHFKLFALRYQPLTTQVFLLPDEYTKSDELYNPRLAVTPQLEPRRAGQERVARAHFDFVLSLLPVPVGQPPPGGCPVGEEQS